MNVLFVYMGTDEELILPLCPAHRRFIADAVGLLRCHLAVGKRLPDLVAQRPVSGPAVGFALIVIFDQHELGVCRGRIAEVGGNGPQLLRVQAIVKAVFQALQGRPLIGPLVGFEVGRSRRQSSFPYDKQRMGSAAVSASSGHRDQNSAHDEAPQGAVQLVQLGKQPSGQRRQAKG